MEGQSTEKLSWPISTQRVSVFVIRWQAHCGLIRRRGWACMNPSHRKSSCFAPSVGKAEREEHEPHCEIRTPGNRLCQTKLNSQCLELEFKHSDCEQRGGSQWHVGKKWGKTSKDLRSSMVRGIEPSWFPSVPLIVSRPHPSPRNACILSHPTQHLNCNPN